VSEAIYSLCALTALLCAWLLLRAYWGRGNILLFWSGLFFVIQTWNNVLLVIDKVVFPHIDMSIIRHGIALAAIVVLLYGLIMRTEGQ
jgi:hypothetical protein